MKKILIKDIFYLVTMNNKKETFCNYDILIEGKEIKKIGKNIDDKVDEVINGKYMLVFPGLINTHHHLYQTFQRNIPAVQNAKLFDWLTRLYLIWKHLNPEVIHYSTLLGCGELLKTGCTTTTDHHYVFPQGINEDLIGIQVEAAKKIGIRFHATRGSMSRGQSKGGLPPDSVVQSEDEILRDSENVINKYHDSNKYSMTQIALAPCSPFSVTEQLMKDSIQLARKKGVMCHTHLCETKDEEDYVIKNHKMRPLEFMESLDWIGEDVWYAHGIYFTDEEIDRLAKTKTKVAHCPSSNMRLGSGICKVPQMLKKGVTVGLAVDGSASNDASDMIGEMRNTLLVHRVLGGSDAIKTDEVFHIATRGGAELFRRNDIGSIEEGKAADIVMINLNRFEYTGALSDPMASIIFSGINHNVDYTIVNGEIVVKDGKLVNVDEREIIEMGNKLSFKMLKDANSESKVGYLI